MTGKPKLLPQLRDLVRQRANYLCEYCQTNERWQYVRFTIDHVVPLGIGGSYDFENLALACFHCNRRKSNKQASFDPRTKEEVPIFNPRTQRWSDHFRWSDDALQILGLTATGRASIDSLDMNRPRVLEIRRADVEARRHPPTVIN
jgi:HNH endonuclease